MLLAIDTCGAVGGVALRGLSGGGISGGESSKGASSGVWSRELAGRTYSEQLLTTVAELLEEAKAALSDLSGVVVIHGPGSFTGIRIGVSAAKGLAEGLAIPVIALSRLELLARQSGQGDSVAVLDAGRGEFYVGFYREDRCETEVLLTCEALSQAVAGSEGRVLVCEQGVFESIHGLNPMLVAAPTAADALAVAAFRFGAGQFDDVSLLEANYLRRSENEMLARVAKHSAQRAGLVAAASQG
jgi:tRNA threonylcarbamoyladenosine biosynthesis protein TsaB